MPTIGAVFPFVGAFTSYLYGGTFATELTHAWQVLTYLAFSSCFSPHYLSPRYALFELGELS